MKNALGLASWPEEKRWRGRKEGRRKRESESEEVFQQRRKAVLPISGARTKHTHAHTHTRTRTHTMPDLPAIRILSACVW